MNEKKGINERIYERSVFMVFVEFLEYLFVYRWVNFFIKFI